MSQEKIFDILNIFIFGLYYDLTLIFIYTFE